MERSHRRHAFTLMELVVIVAVTATILALVAPFYSAKKDREMGNKCMDNLKKLGVGMKLYGADWGGRFPSAPEGGVNGKPHLFTAMSPYISGDVTLFRCPADSGESLIGGNPTPFWSGLYNFYSSYAWPVGWGGCVAGLPQDNPVSPAIANTWMAKLPLSKRAVLWDHRPWHRATTETVSGWYADIPGVSSVLYCDGHVGSERHQWLVAYMMGLSEPN